MRNRWFLLLASGLLCLVACGDGSTDDGGDENPPHYRPKTSKSSSGCTSVLEFLPAPGQFVKPYTTLETQQEANELAFESMSAGGYVSLGGWGGYIVVGFDHSIDNSTGADFAVAGNCFDGSSEPGIVWVAQDSDGDGLPHGETWYELAGSETSNSETERNFSLTYDRSKVPPPLYPAWLTGDSYTLTGTLLPTNVSQDSEGFWVNAAYAWGYADNFGSDLSSGWAHLDISNAMDAAGKPIELPYIDFVKVQTGVNARAGALGEISTEVTGVKDLR